VEALDTNVVVRLLVRDDEEQYRRAELEDGPTTRLALAAFEAGDADFADYLILESARRDGALPLHTFDERLSRSDGAKLV
jgi:predicted nucleic-acid-binding protein